MTLLQQASQRYPIMLFLLICFGWTWLVWFSTLLFADDWAVRKIITGMGFGPALAAIALSLLRGTRCITNTRRWWSWFLAAFSVLLASYLSMLLTGDGLSPQDFKLAKAAGFSVPHLVLCMLSASVGALIVAATFGAELPVYQTGPRRQQRRIWLLVAAALPSVWLLGGVAVASLQGKDIQDVLAGLEPFSWLFYTIRAVLFTLLVVAIGEELGWRGWLLPALQQKFSPLVSSVLVGICWGFWHFPLFINGAYQQPPEQVFAKVGLCVLLAILFTSLHNRSGGNILVAVLLHTAINSSPRLIPLTEEMGLLMLLTIVALLITDKMWRKTS